MKKITLFLFFAFYGASLVAVPAYPFPVVITQPDGSQLSVVMKGDEYYSYTTTEDGHLIAQGADGIFYYASMSSDGNLAAGKMKAHNVRQRSREEQKYIATLSSESEKSKQLTTVTHIQRTNRKKAAQAMHPAAKSAAFPKSGSPKSLVILAAFSDLDFVVPNAQQAFSDQLNKRGYDVNGSTGSARDYFRDNSAGIFDPEFIVVGPYTLPQTQEYYGGNTGGKGTDRNRQEMIAHACKAADDAGVDFSQFDTDNDGRVDNVFVYYAGYNEAEHGGGNTIWPHKWELTPGFHYPGTAASITFDGKRVYDYACTSELKGFVGTTMCGIGTFCHEFGHVLGLPDIYPTGYSSHHALREWDIMDSGGYLNGGKTPAGYSAYERFALGFLKPEVINDTGHFTLEPINQSNKALLISHNNKHNLNGANPFPLEFFLLENRQNTGWDTYLPGHGLLITRINYNQSDWDNNGPNNDPNRMGIDLMEADGIGDKVTLAGDPFPGRDEVTAFDLSSRDGTKFYRAVTNIRETGNTISLLVEKVSDIALSASTLQYEALVNNTRPERTITVTGTNITTSQLRYELKGMNPEMFRMSGDGRLTAGGGNIVLTFDPTAAGNYSAQLVVTDGQFTSATVKLTGVATLSDVAAPQVPDKVSAIEQKPSGFIAAWQAVEGADRYVVNVYTKTGTGVTSVLTENFDRFTDGQPNTKASNVNVATLLDQYTQFPGWTGTRVFAAGGSVKLGGGSSLGMLATPPVDLSGNGGTFTLRFDAAAWRSDRDSIKILLNDLPLQTVRGLDNTAFSFKTFSYTLGGGVNNSVLRFEGTAETNNRFFIDNLLITQGSNGDFVSVASSPVTTTDTSLEVSGLEYGKAYFYKVYAVKGDVNSAQSIEVGPIVLSGTRSEETTTPLHLFWVGNRLMFNASADEAVAVYTVDGVLIHTATAVDGINAIDLDACGMLIIKVGNRFGKVVR